MNLHKYIPLAYIGLAALLSGCVSPSGTSVTKADVITAAEIAAGIVIDNRSNLAEARKVIADVRELIAEGQQITVDGLAEYILTRAVQSQGYSPGQVAALKSFLRRYTDKMTVELDQIGLNPGIVVTVSEVLDAVERVADEIERFGAPLQRSYSTAQFQKPIDESLYGWITDKRTRERYPLTLTETKHAKVDPKLHDGLRHMLANPQPLPQGL